MRYLFAVSSEGFELHPERKKIRRKMATVNLFVFIKPSLSEE
jgi:hypothetical protein